MNHIGAYYTKPYSSFAGFPDWAGYLALAIIAFIIFLVWRAILKSVKAKSILYKEGDIVKADHNINESILHGTQGTIMKIYYHTDGPVFEILFHTGDGHSVKMKVKEEDIIKAVISSDSEKSLEHL